MNAQDSDPRISSVAVIVVNYGTVDLAIEAVESVLEKHHGGREIEVHVVDNASPNDDAKRLSEAHGARGWGDRVRLWLESENHGFGRGNNIVLKALEARAAPPAAVFLLNPDARLENEAIAILADAVEADPGAAAAGAGISLPGGAPVTAAFRFPSPIGEVVQTVNFGPLDRLFHKRRVPLASDLPAGRVDWVAGAAVLFRFDALRDVDFFDPAFFLYYEEVDLMHRLHGRNWRILYEPSARVCHHEGAATEVRSGDTGHPRRPAYLYESWRIYFGKSHGRLMALIIALLVLAAAVANVVLSVLRRRRPSLPKGFFADHWHFVILPLLGMPSRHGRI